MQFWRRFSMHSCGIVFALLLSLLTLGASADSDAPLLVARSVLPAGTHAGHVLTGLRTHIYVTLSNMSKERLSVFGIQGAFHQPPVAAVPGASNIGPLWQNVLF